MMKLKFAFLLPVAFIASHCFTQKVSCKEFDDYQTYTRTGLWMQICEKQGINYLPVPYQLGEDRLARFGAYR
jgi:hypothetical protein